MSTNSGATRSDPHGLREIYGDAGCRWQDTDEYHAHEDCHEAGLRAVAAAAWDELVAELPRGITIPTNPYALVADERTEK